MASSSSSSRLIKRSIDDVQASKENISPNKRINLEYTSFQIEMIDMFKNVDLIATNQLLGK